MRNTSQNIPASPSPSQPDLPDNNSSHSNSPRSNEDDGYETDSNRSFIEQGASAMADMNPRDLPDDQLRRFIRDTEDIMRHPDLAGIEGDEEGNAELRQIWANRNEELRDELRRRKNEGTIPDSSSEYANSSTDESYDSKDGDSNRPDKVRAPAEGNNSAG